MEILMKKVYYEKGEEGGCLYMESAGVKKGISSDLLKWIAIITMFIDHIGAAIVEKTWLMGETYGKPLDTTLRLVGRLAFPIFCFLLVEGLYYTRNRIKYLRNLFVFALLSEIPFELAFFGEIVWGLRNVYFTLLIGFIMVLMIEKINKEKGKYDIVLIILSVAACAMTAEFLHTDYGATGILLIFILYRLRTDRLSQCILSAVAMSYEMTAPIAFVLIYAYNGVRRQKYLKYFFYAFYPLHLLFLYWVRMTFF